jgi:5-amino-6-(5-phospho-D-ribitylamino)uracil phosphatase
LLEGKFEKMESAVNYSDVKAPAAATRPRLIGIDLDGTLLAPGGMLRPRTIQAVAAARKAGVYACVATGRSYRESVNALAGLDAPGLHVFAGGSMVIDRTDSTPDGYRVAARQTMAPKLAQEFCGIVEALGHAVQVLQDPTRTGIDMLRSANQPMDDRETQWLKSNPVRIRDLPDLQYHDHLDTVRCSVVVDSKVMFRIEQAVQDALAGRATWHCIRVPAAGVDVLECFGPDVNKWTGLQIVGRLMGIDDSAIAAVGDDVNDVHMIKGAGRSFAMGNAIAAIKELADEVIDTNDNDGVAKLLESWTK